MSKNKVINFLDKEKDNLMEMNHDKLVSAFDYIVGLDDDYIRGIISKSSIMKDINIESFKGLKYGVIGDTVVFLDEEVSRELPTYTEAYKDVIGVNKEDEESLIKFLYYAKIAPEQIRVTRVFKELF